ncbi:MAG: TrmH family RNA methyltransferase [Planctomycetota bacterium]|jgi:TrmH family RNA methyltransferase
MAGKDMDEVISSIKHPAVVAARRALGQIGRKAATAFLADGRRLVSQALHASACIERVFFRDPAEGGGDADLLRRIRAAGIECHPVTRGVFFRILGLGYETSVGVLAIMNRPRSIDACGLVEGSTCVLAGERIQDPRNVGVLVRTADAWGLPCAIFTDDSADPYSRACVRSSTGSIFRVPLALAADLPAYLARLKGEGARVIGTSAHAEMRCWDADLSGSCVLLLGNESVGLSTAAHDACEQMVTIPMEGGAASFNVTVAAGILLYERHRQTRD